VGDAALLRLLLDTHIWLWSLLEPERLAAPVSAELSSEDNELWISPITLWEVLILAERQRISLDRDPSQWIRSVLNEIPFREAPLNHEVALQSRLVDLPHQDPADRFLVATAQVYDLRFVTGDKRILGCSGLSLLPNR